MLLKEIKIMNDYPLVSVYTCVYNGERTLHRVFESMIKLDYPNIEHVIVNDGSTDNTESLIQEYIKYAPFPVKYHKKPNGGKHTALNAAWSLGEGTFMIQLDADDELFPHSVNFLVDTYYQIPEDIRYEYWCVHGRCITQYGQFIGDRYPDNINDQGWSEAGKTASKCAGEKIGLQVSEYLKRYRFPEVIGVSHIPEGIVWKPLNNAYGTWYTNEVVRVYYVGEGGNLTARVTKRRQFGSAAFYMKWKLTHEKDYGKSFETLVKYSVFYHIADSNYRRHNKYLGEIKNHRIALVLLWPIAYMAAFVYRILKKIK